MQFPISVREDDDADVGAVPFRMPQRKHERIASFEAKGEAGLHPRLFATSCASSPDATILSAETFTPVENLFLLGATFRESGPDSLRA